VNAGTTRALRAEVESLIAAASENSTVIEDSVSDATRDLYASAALAPGDRVSHYKVLKVIGSGGMG
jgi:hypothetical protein